LDFIYKIARHSSAVRWALRRGEERYRRYHGVPLDLKRGWWTPPLAPLDAYRVEARPISAMGLQPIVSLSDHDDIEAPMSLQAVNAALEVPVSVEWTVPFGPTFFHLGIHNLPPRRARATMAALEEITANPAPRASRAMLAELAALPGTLLVFNHPLWDEKGVGADVHVRVAAEFLTLNRASLHAIEMNGLRPWRENRAAVELAAQWNLPVVSGGDRHGVEANAVLNLTRAETFAAFADEVRSGHSHVLITSQYRQSHGGRIAHNVLEVLQPFENHGLGWRDWTDRVFFHCHDNLVRSLKELWGERLPSAVRVFDGMLRLAGNSPVRSAMRAASVRAGQQVTL
jgi:hypothetical protein